MPHEGGWNGLQKAGGEELTASSKSYFAVLTIDTLHTSLEVKQVNNGMEVSIMEELTCISNEARFMFHGGIEGGFTNTTSRGYAEVCSIQKPA